MSNENDRVERIIELTTALNEKLFSMHVKTLKFMNDAVSEIYYESSPERIALVLTSTVSNYCILLMNTVNNSISKSLEELGILKDFTDKVNEREALR